MIQAIAQVIAHAIVLIFMSIVIIAFIGQIVHDSKALYKEVCAERRHKQNK